MRITFLCGKRVLEQLGFEHSLIGRLKTLLNSSEDSLESTAKRLLEEIKQLSKELEAAKDELLLHEAKDLAVRSKDTITAIYEDRSIKELQKLARMVVSIQESVRVILVSKNGRQLQFVCAQGNNGIGDMKKLAGEVLPAINGKGGGSQNFAQGGGEAVMSANDLAALLDSKANME